MTIGTAESGARGRGSERPVACLGAALVWAAVHAVFRDQGAGAGWLSYVALVGSGSLSLVLLALAFEREGLDPGIRRQRRIISLGLGLAVLPWSALGYLLLTATHHRPLGAVTFAVGALASAAAGVLVAAWLMRRHEAGARFGRELLLGAAAIAVSGGLALGWISLRAFGGRPGVEWIVADLMVGAVLTATVLIVPMGRWAVRAKGPVLVGCIALWTVTLWLMSAAPDVRATVKSVPVIAGVFGLAVR